LLFTVSMDVKDDREQLERKIAIQAPARTVPDYEIMQRLKELGDRFGKKSLRNAREHRWPVMFYDQQESLHRCLPLIGIVFCLG
jgi:hypothetical protein